MPLGGWPHMRQQGLSVPASAERFVEGDQIELLTQRHLDLRLPCIAPCCAGTHHVDTTIASDLKSLVGKLCASVLSLGLALGGLEVLP
ncbi:ResB protein required for cytochrome c [Zymobacter palmae]|uniref:ResB protein required for cytochrome c n=1 Tax=Zymobacter palmae TaxID=33074 RepID=A0A348HCM5_9GAMM|nr:ResB protein required for cytochrome c [Zymobacter palmae]